MKNALSVLSLAALCGVAHADPLAEAAKLWETRQYEQAAKAYATLAEAGNGAAQLQLGEMIGFGEGMPENPGQARMWIERAARAGQPGAAATLALVNERAAHKADIAYYMSGFDGGAARYANFACVRPAMSTSTESAAQIRKTDAAVKAWRDCFDRFSATLNAALPAGKAIPADIQRLMRVDELDEAKLTMDHVYSRIGNEAQALATQAVAEQNAWRDMVGHQLEAYRELTMQRFSWEAHAIVQKDRPMGAVNVVR